MRTLLAVLNLVISARGTIVCDCKYPARTWCQQAHVVGKKIVIGTRYLWRVAGGRSASQFETGTDHRGGEEGQDRCTD